MIRTSAHAVPTFLASLVLLLFAMCARPVAQDRLPPIAPDKMTDAQKQAVADFVAVRGGTGVAGPWVPLLRSPDLLNRVRTVSDYFRMKTSLAPKLREFIVLLTAREWTNQFEWLAHQRTASDAGLKADLITAISEGRRPERMAEDEEIVYDFCAELNRRESVSDTTYARALGKLGEEGVVDMTALAGYYSFLGMISNAGRTPPAGGAAPALKPLPR